ncbi:LptA/OstA family protein [Chitinispirillales bacterium ANBcel5]|uniref:hypothetical protein n=1 Tax=Cellulosispirillum alkaliphilum TaxID=3039283 RepID=UPI002A51D2C4|nr:LptA/OstA family protein [Chitinispirillales bacterium ANBcel5]
MAFSNTQKRVAWLGGVVFCSLTFLFFSVLAQPTRNHSDELVLEYASVNENIFRNGEFVSYLRGDVVFSYDDIRIRSDEATWRRNDGEVRFRNRVKVERSGQFFRSNRVDFTSKENIITARGDFYYYDSLELVSLSGNQARYDLEEREFILEGSPRLEHYDTAASQTLVITGHTMNYCDKEKVAGVQGEVKIERGELLALCNRAYYYTDSAFVKLRVNPSVRYESHDLEGDSVDLFFAEENLKSAWVKGNSRVSYIEASDEGDTVFSDIWSDSLFVQMCESGNIDTLFAYGNVLTRYFGSEDTTRVNKAWGRTMVLAFDTLGKISSAVIRGNARSVYYIDESDGQGRNEASGDSIIVYFDKGRTERIRLSGSTRGVYFPQN